MNIDIQISKNDIVTENIELIIKSNDTYEIIDNIRWEVGRNLAVLLRD